MNPPVVNQMQSKTLRDYNRTDLHVYSKVSNKKSRFCDVVNSINNFNTSKQDCVALTTVSLICDSMKQGSNYVGVEGLYITI